jgi:hypothetical protein
LVMYTVKVPLRGAVTRYSKVCEPLREGAEGGDGDCRAACGHAGTPRNGRWGQGRARVGRIPWGDPKLAPENRGIAC